MGKYAAVVQTSAEEETPDIRSAAVINKTGELSVYFLNNSQASRHVSVKIDGRDSHRKMYLYQVSEKLVSNGNFSLEPMPALPESAGKRSVTLPPKSISVLTDYHLTPKDPGIIG
jgi:hypothetical protein